MTPLPAPLGGGPLTLWRLDEAQFAPSWDSGEGAFRYGGRWNNRGLRAVYAAFDPATAVLELAVHKGFAALDTVPHVLTSFVIPEAFRVHVVQPADVPNPHWLHPGPPSAGQRAFGGALLARHDFVAIPSAVSARSWNLIFDAARAATHCRVLAQERFALDPRLHPA